jgi:hypothetical protein
MSVQSGRLLEETYNLEFNSQDVVVFDFQADISGVDTNSLQDQDRSQARGEMWLWFYTPSFLVPSVWRIKFQMTSHAQQPNH